MKLFDNIIIVLTYTLPAAFMLWLTIQLAVRLTKGFTENN
jgi:hypothetical protein